METRTKKIIGWIIVGFIFVVILILILTGVIPISTQNRTPASTPTTSSVSTSTTSSVSTSTTSSVSTSTTTYTTTPTPVVSLVPVMYKLSPTNIDNDVNWLKIICNTNGTRLVACVQDRNGSGYIYTSNNSGSDWNKINLPVNHYWQAAAMNTEGTKIVIGGFQSNIWIFDGVLWSNSGQESIGLKPWSNITSNDIGNQVIATTGETKLYMTTDTGVTWNVIGNINMGYITDAVNDPSGNRIAICGSNGLVGISTDRGGSWNLFRVDTIPLRYIRMSSDGKRLVVLSHSGNLYISSNGGLDWSKQFEFENSDWRNICCSVDGLRMAVCVFEGYIWVSENGGINWKKLEIAERKQWFSIACDSKADVIYAGLVGGNLYRIENPFSELSSSI